MSAIVRSATQEDVEPICRLLHSKMNQRIPVQRWRHLMNYPWLENKPDFGRVVESEGQILGFCGMVYSDRLIGNAHQGLRAERMVSMSSWYLDKSLRGQGLGRDMLIDAVKDKTQTYATLTNSKKPLAIVEALGFKKLETARYIWQRTTSKVLANWLITETESMHQWLEPYQKQLIDDMKHQPLTPVLLQENGKQALLFFSITSKAKGVTWYDLMYSSDLALFSQCAQKLANELLPDDDAKMSADSRFVPNPDSQALWEELPVSRYYISERAERYEIDHLYSELQLLDLKLD